MMKLSIGRKLMLSYLAMALLTVLASAYAIFSLQNLNGLAYTIINRDFFILETSKKMVDLLFAQESAEKKYLILKDLSIADIFWTRSGEFKKEVSQLTDMKSRIPPERLAVISKQHDQYNVLFKQEMDLVTENRIEDATALSDTEGKKLIEMTVLSLQAIQHQAEKDIDANMKLIKERGLTASRMTVILSIISLIGGLSLALLITYDISKPLKKLEKATGLIAQGQFDHSCEIKRPDEIGSLANAFGTMTERLKELEALYLDASPLTGLPGNLAIEQEIERRLLSRRLFALCHVDLDNFKPFADRYGYAWGSEVIKAVADILMDQVKKWGKDDDFVGHVGGDDFILVSTPRRAEKICREAVEDFDNRINAFYNEKDRRTGYIIGKDRQGVERQFPLITITIAIVSDDGTRFRNPLDMAKKAAELKEHAKTFPGSNCMKEEDLHELGTVEQVSQ